MWYGCVVRFTLNEQCGTVTLNELCVVRFTLNELCVVRFTLNELCGKVHSK